MANHTQGPDQDRNASLQSLSDRLEESAGPDRELDCLIAVLCDGYFKTPPRFEGDCTGYGYDQDGKRILPGHGGDQLVPTYTASIDTALSLGRRLFPGWMWTVHAGTGTLGCSAHLWAPHSDEPYTLAFADERHAAIAVLGALVAALIKQADLFEATQ